MKKHTQDVAFADSLKYFDGDELAASVFVSKYALRDGNGDLLERTPEDMHRRLAKEFARIEAKYPVALSEEEIFGYLSRWEIVPQGSPMSAMGNPYKVQSLSNCFVIAPPEDSYGGILFADQEQAQIMKRRGGVGFDISTIRPRGQVTANAAGTTDGIGVFMERFSNTCREVAQGGRRGALMLTISVDHPEIETFINIKRDLKKVTGANISIRLTDAFMQAVKDDADYVLRWPVDTRVEDAKVTKHVKSKAIWDQIIDAAWASAEPGLLFWDTVKRNTPTEVYANEGYGSVSTNPCIVGNTLLATADGRNAVSIKQLAEEGKDVPVYSTNPRTGQVEVKWGRNPRLTKKNAEVWKLTLDDGSVLIATPDHKIMKRDCTYVELKYLQSGDSVFPFASFNSNGYRQVCNTGIEMVGGARRNRRQYRLIHEFHYGPTDAKNFAIHHVDHNSLNDSVNNMQVMTHKEHHELHSKNMLGELNPYHKMPSDWKKNFATHPGETNGRYSGHTNAQILEHGREIFKKHGKITGNLWADHAKENGLPQFLANEFRFGTWQNFVNQVSNNHKVVSVERFGIEDVYNITVDDNHNYHVITSHEDDKFVVSSGLCVKNCGEIVLSPYDSCRLLLLNLSKFVNDPFTDKAAFDHERFASAVVVAQRLMDDLVDLELEAVDAIIKKIEDDPESKHVKAAELDLWNKIKKAASGGRRTGLGVTAMGDTLAFLGIRYGSQESVDKTEEIYRALSLSAYQSSIEMASERGTFPVYDTWEKEMSHPFLKQVSMSLDADIAMKWRKHGRRNIALTTTAPAGSVSCLTQTTSGIEPAFLVSYTRRKKLTSTDVVSRVDFVDALGDKWQEYKVYHHGYKKWMDVTGKGDVVESSPYWKATSNDVDWEMSVKLQAAAQKWICHSLSKTCNLPNDTTREVVAKVYMSAWESGCKGFTVYRDGCRTGVLVAEEPKKPTTTVSGEDQPEVITENHAPKRPKELPCDIHRINVKGSNGPESYLVLVGKLDGKPYEVFCGLSSHVEVPKKVKNGILIKNGKKDGVATYNLQIPMGEDDCLLFKDVVNLFANPNHGSFTRTLSLALRHGVPVSYVVEQLQKDKQSDMQSFSRVLARVLKGYIPDGTKSASDKTCNNCGVDGLTYKEGCVTCVNCGSSKCG
jgi:ribonucleotide reductase alpha subunit